MKVDPYYPSRTATNYVIQGEAATLQQMQLKKDLLDKGAIQLDSDTFIVTEDIYDSGF